MEEAMNTMIRFDPFDNMLIPELFKGRGFASNLPWPADLAVDFKVDVSESDKEYRVMAELPGIAKDDITIAVERDMLTIGAEVRKESVEKAGERLVRSERFIGTLRRSFSLGADVDADKVVANYDNGMLSLTLPKKVPGSMKRIMVS
jgi:HSP20 family protein